MSHVEGIWAHAAIYYSVTKYNKTSGWKGTNFISGFTRQILLEPLLPGFFPWLKLYQTIFTLQTFCLFRRKSWHILLEPGDFLNCLLRLLPQLRTLTPSNDNITWRTWLCTAKTNMAWAGCTPQTPCLSLLALSISLPLQHSREALNSL